MATRYAFRSPSSAHEAALMICADFAAECKRQGDMANCYRWRNVIAVERLRGSAMPVSGYALVERELFGRQGVLSFDNT